MIRLTRTHLMQNMQIQKNINPKNISFHPKIDTFLTEKQDGQIWDIIIIGIIGVTLKIHILQFQMILKIWQNTLMIF